MFDSPYSHSFLEIIEPGSTKYVEVSPNLQTLLPSMTVNDTTTGIYNDSTAGHSWWSISGSSICADASELAKHAGALPLSLYLGLTSNSNSFVSTMLAYVGLLSGFGSPPPLAIGWGDPIIPYPSYLPVRLGPTGPAKPPTLGPSRPRRTPPVRP